MLLCFLSHVRPSDPNSFQPALVSSARLQFTDNLAQEGSALYLVGIDSTLVVARSTFTGNSAQECGAVVASRIASVSVNQTSFLQNAATRGGAMCLVSTKATIAASTFVGNTAMYAGAVAITGDAAVNMDSIYAAQNVAGAYGGFMTVDVPSEQGSAVMQGAPMLPPPSPPPSAALRPSPPPTAGVGALGTFVPLPPPPMTPSSAARPPPAAAAPPAAATPTVCPVTATLAFPGAVAACPDFAVACTPACLLALVGPLIDTGLVPPADFDTLLLCLRNQLAALLGAGMSVNVLLAASACPFAEFRVALGPPGSSGGGAAAASPPPGSGGGGSAGNAQLPLSLLPPPPPPFSPPVMVCPPFGDTQLASQAVSASCRHPTGSGWCAVRCVSALLFPLLSGLAPGQSITGKMAVTCLTAYSPVLRSIGVDSLGVSAALACLDSAARTAATPNSSASLAVGAVGPNDDVSLSLAWLVGQATGVRASASAVVSVRRSVFASNRAGWSGGVAFVFNRGPLPGCFAWAAGASSARCFLLGNVAAHSGPIVATNMSRLVALVPSDIRSGGSVNSSVTLIDGASAPSTLSR